MVFNTMKDFGYSEILLPIFEHTELFSRGVGEITNIVTKEMHFNEIVKYLINEGEVIVYESSLCTRKVSNRF